MLFTLFRLHFEARSPSPSSNFEYKSLAYIELPDRDNSTATNSGMGHAPGNYQPFGASELRLGRLPSASEYRDEALSFSTLPTSQFVLKPSSNSAMELSEQQHSLLMQNATFEPYSWSWVRNVRLNPLHVRRTTDHGSSVSSGSGAGVVGGNYHPHPSSAPTNYHHQISGPVGGNVASSSPHHHPQQLLQGSLSSTSEPRDISRSSLSVTSSKTIILSNAPVSHAPPTATPTPSTATSSTNSAAPALKTTPVMVPSRNVSQSQLQAQQLAAVRRAGLSTKPLPNNVLLVQQRHDQAFQPQGLPSATKLSVKKEGDSKGKVPDGTNKAVEKTAAAPPPSQVPAAATQGESTLPNGGQSLSAESANLNPPSGTKLPVKAGELRSVAGEPMNTTSPTSGTPRKTPESTTNSQSNIEKLKSSDSKSSLKKVEDDDAKKSLSAWMVSKPTSSILQLSRLRKRKREEQQNDDDESSSPNTKIRRTKIASAEAALLIASQFAKQIVKKEETSQLLTVTQAFNPAVVGIAGTARNVASVTPLSTVGLPISTVATATASAISHNITKIPLSVATASNSPAMQTAAAKLLTLDSIQPLPNQQAQTQQQQAVVAVAAAVNSVSDGVGTGGHLAGVIGQDKKAIVNAVSASGQAQALSTNLAVRRTSTGTNGTNSYQEMYRTERMKQALAG